MNDYSIIESDSTGELCEAVHLALKDGWTCQGGVCVWWDPRAWAPTHSLGSQSPGAPIYVQALIKPIL